VRWAHCVIIGFAAHDTKIKRLFEYENIKSEPHEILVQNINSYLVAGDDVVMHSRKKHIQSNAPEITFGSMPNDGGNFLFDNDEKEEFIHLEPNSSKYIKRYMGAEEFINNKSRWCLWLKNCTPNELKIMPKVLERVEKVKEARNNSNREATNKLAKTPTLFGEDRQPNSKYIIIPSITSENRNYIPIGFLEPDIIVSNRCHFVENATLYHFAILTSLIHNDWMRYIAGRLKSDYLYSAEIVYNNFPFPCHPELDSGSQIADQVRNDKTKIETLAQAILDARAEFPDSSLADLYNPLTMPPKLLKAHEALDKAVDKLYRKEGFKSDTERVAHLFELNRTLTSLVREEKKAKK
jgi:hypothetical protein